MSGNFPFMPSTPADVPVVSLDVVLATYQHHMVVLTAARAAVDRRPAGDVGRRASAALALGQALVDDPTEERWPVVRDGLLYGATVEQVGAALGGLEVDEVRAGLTSWADRQFRGGALTLAEYDAVLILTTDGAR